MKYKKIKIEQTIYEKAVELYKEKGYSSLEEFIEHLVDKESSLTENDTSGEEQADNMLRGLGYIE